MPHLLPEFRWHSVAQADGGAEATITAISSQLANLDGSTATIYINTLGGNTVGFTPEGLATGGTVSKYATGGTHGGDLAIVGEYGPEVVWLPNGAQVTNAAASRATAERVAAGAGTINQYHGTVVQTITLDNSSFARRQTSFAGYRRSGG